MKRKYWSGATRLISDLFWCLVIAIVICYFSHRTSPLKGAEFVGSFVTFFFLSFFLFFFWSWNKGHVKKNFVRASIHIISGLFLLIMLCFMGAALSCPSIANSFTAIYLIRVFCFYCIITFFAMKRYIRLMRKESQSIN